MPDEHAPTSDAIRERDAFMRSRLNRLVDADVSAPVGHSPKRITAAASSLRLAISDEHLWRLQYGPQLPIEYRPPPHRSPECLTVRENPEAAPSYGASRGIDPKTVSANRFDGTWCLWTARLGSPEVCTLQTRSAMDSTSALRLNINQVLDDCSRHTTPTHPALMRRAIDLIHKPFQKLHEVVDDWEATLKGHTTHRTMTDDQLHALGKRVDCKDISDAALKGDPTARHECLSILRFHELKREFIRDNRGSTRPDGLESPRTFTWSLWTSKGHPEDRQLVVTRRAVDALSFHELHPDPRTRYVSFDGPPTPTRNAIIDRALALMPDRSTVVLAPDCSPRGRALADSVERLAQKYPSLQCVRSEPALDISWHQRLQKHLRQTPDPTPPRTHCMSARQPRIHLAR